MEVTCIVIEITPSGNKKKGHLPFEDFLLNFDVKIYFFPQYIYSNKSQEICNSKTEIAHNF